MQFYLLYRKVRTFFSGRNKYTDIRYLPELDKLKQSISSTSVKLTDVEVEDKYLKRLDLIDEEEFGFYNI